MYGNSLFFDQKKQTRLEGVQDSFSRRETNYGTLEFVSPPLETNPAPGQRVCFPCLKTNFVFAEFVFQSGKQTLNWQSLFFHAKQTVDAGLPLEVGVLGIFRGVCAWGQGVPWK